MGDIQRGKGTLWKRVRQSEMSVAVCLFSFSKSSFDMLSLTSHLSSQTIKKTRRVATLVSFHISFIRGRYLEGDPRKFSVVKKSETRIL